MTWKDYAAGTDGPDFAAFCETLIQTTDAFAGKPLSLEPFQRFIFDEALAYQDEGSPVWRSTVIVMPRKNGKTTLLAAYALYRLLYFDGDPSILLSATSDEQANHLFKTCAKFVYLSGLQEECRVRDHEGTILRNDGLGQIKRIGADPKRAHGHNPTLVIADELAQWTTPSLKDLFEALTTAGGARRAPQVFSITTAGHAHERHTSMLGRMLDESMNGEMDEEPGRKVARNWPAQMLVINYEAPTNNPKDVEKIKLANPASWITTDYLTRQAANPELTESAFLQLHACVWAERQDAWLPAGSWEKLALEREVGDTPCVFGFDGSDTGDSTALVGCTMEETPHVFVIGVWQRPPKAVDWFVPRDEVEACLDAAVNRYNVQRLLCDPPGWRREIQEWSERYRDIYTVMFKTNQRKLATVACSRFHAAVITKSLTHDGNPDLAEHIGNAVVKETPEGNYITKDHKASQRKIDLAVAAVMAHYAAVDYKPSVYESRGVVTIA